ncbi:cyclic peptide export ABC transporter [Paenibacillus tarimensis]|uniref:cyclic peptide export ABC transporter n=1 Tax=Paenibacillus tarimensis TaxID=416012 RepID=UPI001F33D9D8|nr:cyclic peptide export ABC transporter [Paenibacillus tarimensis]MCF2945316.1 cyclic peptide export ABC transporter [Paenibacillus tarimensis]
MKYLRLTGSMLLAAILLASALLTAGAGSSVSAASAAAAVLPAEMTADIEHEIKRFMDQGQIPGMSVVIVRGEDVVYSKGFGFADQEAGRPVTDSTFFELGSTSKAYTALGVLKLSDAGLIKLDEPVQTYLPWLELTYEGEKQAVTLRQFLHHTSGIPFKTIDDIPALSGDDALEKTVRTLAGIELEHEPGSRHLYATINYDVLALVIEKVTGQSFEQYMYSEILQPLGLNNTYLFRQDVPEGGMATGYKLQFFGESAYDAPVYRGNTAAGYVISNAGDMAKWLKIQLGTAELTKQQLKLVNRSHMPNRSIQPNADGSSYAMGWSVYQDGGGELSHDGSNPNFSSYVGIRPGEKVGVAVMANINSTYTIAAGQSILNVMIGKAPVERASDMFKDLDRTSAAVILIALPLALLTLGFFIRSIAEVFSGRRRWKNRGWTGVAAIAASLLLLGLFGYCLYLVPDVLFSELSWDFVRVWAPDSLYYAILSIGASAVLFFLYSLFTYFMAKPNDKAIFNLAILSIFSGLGNAFIIFTINVALGSNEREFQSNLFIFFTLGILVYIVGQRIIRTNLVSITNDIVYNKRMELIGRILKSPFYKFEEIEGGKIHAGLNNDTETISDFANTFITGVTSLITLICCFVYLGIINWMGLLAALGIIALCVGLYIVVGMSANKLWGETRDIQNVFFRYINDLVQGFKELSMDRRRRREFHADIQESCETYRDKRKQAEFKIAGAFVVGELLFTLVVGSIAFLFPLMFRSIEMDAVRSYVFIFLYMMGPIHSILNAVPNVIQMRISWNRINDLIKEVSAVETVETEAGRDAHAGPVHIELRNLCYKYGGENGESFSVGPINYEFRSNEVVFITGGNGSGKSTVAKLITGLYVPTSGEILLNGSKVTAAELGSCFSTIFSDFYLFEKLYGVDVQAKQQDIERYLKLLKIDGKVAVQDGKFSTIKLSTGQRKRLALLLSYLEDKPVCLFDEWAADQDPEFRRFFYESLLPELKQRGKCIIAITHDDRYFELADKMMKMEFGMVMQLEAAAV